MSSQEPELGGTDPVYFFNIDDGRWQQYLSQWYDCRFKDKSGVEYRSTEMYMMYQKAMLFGDSETAEKIRKAATPKEQKELGRQVKNFDSQKWNAYKSRIVESGNYLKFTQGSSHHQSSDPEPKPGSTLKDMLLETGEKQLIEASPYDRIWGIGFSIEDAPTSRRSEWGQNLLGKAIMNARARIKSS